MNIVLQLKDDLDLKAATALRVKLSNLTGTKHEHWFIDLSEVNSVGNVGLVTLVEANKLAKRSGRRLSLCNLRESVQYIFAITELDRQLDILDGYDYRLAGDEKVVF